MLDKTLNPAGNGVNCRIALGIVMIEEHTMAALSWTPAQPQPWIEKYRAALIETNPTVRLERIAEASHAIEDSIELSDTYERHAIEDARLILRLLREESLGRADSAPWL